MLMAAVDRVTFTTSCVFEVWHSGLRIAKTDLL